MCTIHTHTHTMVEISRVTDRSRCHKDVTRVEGVGGVGGGDKEHHNAFICMHEEEEKRKEPERSGDKWIGAEWTPASDAGRPSPHLGQQCAQALRRGGPRLLYEYGLDFALQRDICERRARIQQQTLQYAHQTWRDDMPLRNNARACKSKSGPTLPRGVLFTVVRPRNHRMLPQMRSSF